MKRTARKEIIATLIEQGRPDLANVVMAAILRPGEIKALDKAINGLEQADGNLRAMRHADYLLDKIEPILDELRELRRYAEY